MSPAGLSRAPRGNKQFSMRLGDGAVVTEHRDAGRDLLDERSPPSTMTVVTQRDADEQLRQSYGCDRYVVVIVDNRVERSSRAVGRHKERRVQ